MCDMLIKFEDYLINWKSVSSNTTESYMRDVKAFTNYFEKQSLELTDICSNDLRSYILYLEKLGRSSSTVTRNIASIRCYYQYLILSGNVNVNPVKEIKREKEIRKTPSTLTSVEINLLLSQPDVNDIKGCRDKAMLELLYATGIKVSELVNLDINDINLKSGILICKNNQSKRIIPIYDNAVICLSNYINKVRKAVINTNGQALFVNLNGNRLTRQGFWKIVKSYAKSASIEKKITPLTLRHSFAMHLLENGANLDDIREMLGHADISSTQIYADMLAERIKGVYNKYHPMADK